MFGYLADVFGIADVVVAAAYGRGCSMTVGSLQPEAWGYARM